MFVLLPICFAVALCASPADEMRSAVADLQQQLPETRGGIRYLTLYSIDANDRADAIKVTSYVLNSLSRTRAISKPIVVTPTLVRFSIAEYAPRSEEYAAWVGAWEKLAESDSYFHLRTQVIADEKIAHGKLGSGVASSSVAHSSSAAIRTVTTDGGWVDLTAAAQLRTTTLSVGALLRADDFIARATIASRYYEFAGIPDTENDFLKSIGVDRAVIDRLRANAGANLAVSGVTAKPRRIVWAQGPLGGVYSTLDVETVDAQRDPLRRPLTTAGLAYRYDLGEWFALAPNGLWRTALFNSDGRRQNSVPDRVAKDTSDPAGDGIVVPLVSCIRCHREAGLRPFVDDQTKLLTGRINLYGADPNIIQRALEFYDEARLARQMSFDRQTYTDAVARATEGLAPDQLADSLAKLYRSFTYKSVSVAQASIEVGLTVSEFRQALSQSRDPIILLLLENQLVLRGQWESSFAEAALAAQAFKRTTPSPIAGK